MRRKFITTSSFEAKENTTSGSNIYRVESRESVNQAGDHGNKFK